MDGLGILSRVPLRVLLVFRRLFIEKLQKDLKCVF